MDREVKFLVVKEGEDVQIEKVSLDPTEAIMLIDYLVEAFSKVSGISRNEVLDDMKYTEGE